MTWFGHARKAFQRSHWRWYTVGLGNDDHKARIVGLNGYAPDMMISVRKYYKILWENNLYYIKIDAIPCQLEAETIGDRIQKVDLLRGRGQLQGETLPGFAERGEQRKGDGVETRMGMKPAFGCVVLDRGLAMVDTNGYLLMNFWHFYPLSQLIAVAICRIDTVQIGLNWPMTAPNHLFLRL